MKPVETSANTNAMAVKYFLLVRIPPAEWFTHDPKDLSGPVAVVHLNAVTP